MKIMKDCLFKPLDKMAFWIQDDFRKKNKIIQVFIGITIFGNIPDVDYSCPI